MSGLAEGGPALPLRRLRLRADDGTELAADELEGDAPACVFLHGLASTRAGDKSNSLAAYCHRKGRRLLRLDFRGHGESAGKIEDLTLTGLVADARAALDHVGRAVVVGSSLGGLTGAWLAATKPQRVSGLVLIAPAFAFLRRMAARPRTNGRIRIDSAWVQVQVEENVLDDARAWPESELPRRLSMPTLIVHGARDDVVPVADTEHVFAAIPHARKSLWVVPDGDHRLVAHVEEIWARMEQLLAAD